MLSATTGSVASITGRDRSDSTWVSLPVELSPPLARSRSADRALPVLDQGRRTTYARACRRGGPGRTGTGRTGADDRGWSARATGVASGPTGRSAMHELAITQS